MKGFGATRSRPDLICHLIDANIETAYFTSIADRHDRLSFPVIIGSIAPEGDLQSSMRDRGVATFSLGAVSRGGYARALTRLCMFLRRNRVSILHSHCFDPTLVGLLAARLTGTRFVFTRHHSDHNIRLGKKLHTAIDSWCARHSDQVIAVSEATARILMEEESVPRKRITVVHNGLIPLSVPDGSRVAALRNELGIGDEHVCLVIARLHEEKGHRFLFAALQEIEARSGLTGVLLAGDGPHRSDLELEVRKRGLDDRVCFLGRRDDIGELIAISSVLVLPSLAESFGFVLLEAMSLGKPVVATRVGGIPELVDDGETGLLVEPENPAELASAVSRVLNDDGLAARMGKNGRERAARFTFERMIKGYEAVYRRVLEYRSGERVDARGDASRGVGQRGDHDVQPV